MPSRSRLTLISDHLFAYALIASAFLLLAWRRQRSAWRVGASRWLAALRRTLSSGFGRSVLALGGGAAVAQGMTMALAPILARLYTPEAFGLYATYMTVVSILALAATAKLEWVIMLPRRDRQGAALLVLLLAVCAITTLAFWPLLAALAPALAGWLDRPALVCLLWAAPLSAFLLGSYQGLRFWAMRRGAYNDVARNMAIRTGAGTGFACVLALLPPVAAVPGLGLVVAQILGEGLGNAALARAVRRRDAGLFRPARRLLVPLARRYGRLALTYTASAGVTTVCDSLQILVVGWLYGASAAGFLSWADRFTALPARLVASAIADVYRQSAAAEYHRTGRFDGLTRKTLAATGALAVAPYGLGIWLAPSLFEWLFGAQWRPAGEIASIIMVSGFVSFVVSSIDSAILVRGRGLFTIGRHSARLVGEAAAAFAAFTLSLPLATMLWLLVGIRVAVYLTDGAYAWYLAKGEDARRPLLGGRRVAQAACLGELHPTGTIGL